MFLSESNYASLCTFLLQLSWGLHLQFFPFADYPCAILVTTFPFFLICRLSPALYLWPHLQFFPFVDYLRAILVTAFTIFPICRLSLLYTCDCIRNFSHLQIIPALYLWPHFLFFAFVDYLRAILVTAFTIILICRLSSAPHLPYDCVWGCLQAGLSHVWTMNTREACVTRCRLVSATKPTVWATASLGNRQITDACSE